MIIEPAWQGTVQFHELVFGTWLAYAFLAWMWEIAIKVPLTEWKYVLITYFGASFFLVNHYFMRSGFWVWLINGYSVAFMAIYYKVAVRPVHGGTRLWKMWATLSSILFFIAYIGFVFIARFIVNMGYHEFWVRMMSYFGYLMLIMWRAKCKSADRVVHLERCDRKIRNSRVRAAPISPQRLPRTTNWPYCSERNVVLVVGSTGSLGKAVVTELRQRGIPLRLLGRSRESFVSAGLTIEKNVELVVCTDVTDFAAFHEDWFLDVKSVICVARPRWSKADDREIFAPLVQNLSEAVLTNGVPNMLLLGLPYVDRFLFGLTRNMETYRGVEMCVREIFEAQSSDKSEGSSLSIVRITEMSEIGALLEFARMTGLWLRITGSDPYSQPISAKDFATAVARLVQGDDKWKEEILLGGPDIISWRELGKLIEKSIGKRLFLVSLPLCVLKVMVRTLDYAGTILPFLEGLANVLKIVSIPMTANATSDKHQSVGEDRLEDYLREHAKPGVATDVQNRIFRPARAVSGQNYRRG